MARLLIGGDLCPVGLNRPLFERGDAPALLGEFLPEFQQADLTVVNLECPLVSRDTSIAKTGPVLGAPLQCVRGLEAMGIDLMVLANNHIMDHGPAGLQSTLSTLAHHGISHVGAGETLDEARRIWTRDLGGLTVGVLAVAEREFNLATRNEAGANPLNVIDFVRTVRAHRGAWDHLVVLLHGGNEFYPFPRPGLRDTCRFLIEQGAGAVIVQHSHCCGCMETHHEAPVVYGQGNLLFDMPAQPPEWYEGILVSLELEKKSPIRARLIPFKQIPGRPGIHRMTPAERESLIRAFTGRSELLCDQEQLEQRWRHFCDQQEGHYLRSFYGHKMFWHRVLGKVGLLDRFYTRRRCRISLGAIQCQSHCEAITQILASRSAGARPGEGPARRTTVPTRPRIALEKLTWESAVYGPEQHQQC